MDTLTGELTVFDMLQWEPSISLVSPVDPTSSAALWRDLDWVLTARSSAPMLPHLRGGELVILPAPVVRETGVPFSRLISEITMQPIAGVLTDVPRDEIPPSPLVIMTMPALEPDAESTLNRLLTTQRRSLLQQTSQIDRLLAEAIAGHRPQGDTLAELSAHINLPIRIAVASGGHHVHGTGDVPLDPGSAEGVVSLPMRDDRLLTIGPFPLREHALARMVLPRIRDGLQRLIDTTSSSAPRGSARILALNSLLRMQPSADRGAIAQRADNAGLPPGRTLHVVLTPRESPEARVRHALGLFGDVLDAGDIDGFRAHLAIHRQGDRSGPEGPHPSTEIPWMVLSAPIRSAQDLPDGARQARFLATLRANDLLRQQIIRFDDHTRLGVYRLLYDAWGTATLETWQTALLNGLRREDRRGQLTETLRAYLNHGGARSATADALGIHRNTLAYRLNQIRQCLGMELDDPHVRLTLQLALVAQALPDPKP